MIPTIWSEATIQRFADEGEKVFFKELPCIVDRYAVPIIQGTASYILPDYIYNIRQVTYKGYVLDPIRTREYEEYGYSVISNTSQGKPREYVYSGIGQNKILLYPVPNESISAITTGLFGTEIANRCIIEYYRYPDTTTSTVRIPPYILRRSIKNYVLWHCYQQESKGLNLTAANYYKTKFLKNDLPRFKRIYDRLFKAKFMVLGGQGARNNTLHKPVLPQRFERSE